MTKNFDIFPKSGEGLADFALLQQYQDVTTAGYAVLTGLVGSRTNSAKISYTSGTYTNGGLYKSSDVLPHLYIDSILAATSGYHRYDLIYIDGTDNTIKRETGTEDVPSDPTKFLENYFPRPAQLGDTDWTPLSIICVTDAGIASENFGSYALAGVCNLKKSNAMAADGTTVTVSSNGVLSTIATKSSGSSTGNGSQKTHAHGLNATPSRVLVYPVSDPTNTTITYGSPGADGTNIYVTVTSSKTYRWIAEI